MIKYLLFIILFVSNCFAEPIPCLDVLGGANYKKEILQTVPRDYIIGLFDNTFGESLPVAKAYLESGGRGVRVNFLWSDSHSYGDKDIPRIKKIAKKWEPTCKAYPGKVWASPFTEHNLSNPDKYLNIVKQESPSCIVTNTPWRGALSSKYQNEVHGNHAKPKNGVYSYSYDGTNSVDSNVISVRKAYSDSIFFCMWNPRFNGKWSMKDTTPRPQRKAWPNKEMLQANMYLFGDKGNTSIPKNWLIKPLAEKHGIADSKGDKLLVISPVKDSHIELKKGGKSFKLPYYGTYQGGGYRYYSSSWGYQLGAGLEVYAKKKKYGSINGGFRDPTFR